MSELAWDSYKCKCGGDAVMGIMSLVARCDKCPRVFAYVSMTGKGRWFPDINAANEAYRSEEAACAPKETK